MSTLAAGGPFDTAGGLPVHTLVVHAVVVLVPLTALGAIAIALVPRWSHRFGVLVPLFGLAGFVASLVAQLSGEQLAARVGLPAQHVQFGLNAKWFTLALLVVSTVLWLADRRTEGPRPVWLKLFAALVVVVALAALGWIVLTGDSGSRAVWELIVRNTGG
jgi:hypothetical protein